MTSTLSCRVDSVRLVVRTGVTEEVAADPVAMRRLRTVVAEGEARIMAEERWGPGRLSGEFPHFTWTREEQMSAPTNSNPASNRITVPGIGDPSQPETVIVVRGHGRFDVVAYNECGHNWTETDLKALLDWIHDNRPWILKEIGYSKESAG